MHILISLPFTVNLTKLNVHLISFILTWDIHYFNETDAYTYTMTAGMKVEPRRSYYHSYELHKKLCWCHIHRLTQQTNIFNM